MASDVGLTAERVSYAFNENDAVREVTLTLQRGSSLALTGPNGSGKTTLLRMLSGALTPRMGCIRLDGTDLKGVRARVLARRIAVVPQHVDPNVSLRVSAVVGLGRTPYSGLWRPLTAFDRRAIQEAMKDTGVADLGDKLFNELSGGEQQRVALAMALAQDTDFILLDEPTVHLDLHHQRALLELLHSLQRTRNLGVLAVMHDLNLAALYFEAIAVLHGGSLIAVGSPDKVLRDQRSMQVFGAPLHTVTHPQTGDPQVLLERGYP